MKTADTEDLHDRERLMWAFLRREGWGDASVHVLADDASFRRYLRVEGTLGRAVLMDAPPDREDIRPFSQISRFLNERGFSAPKIMAEDEITGFMILEDFGDDTYTKLLKLGADERELYCLATDTLIALHEAAREGPSLRKLVPAYNWERYRTELSLFLDWYWPAITGNACPESVRRSFEDAWHEVLVPLDTDTPTKTLVPTSLVLRDFHVDNMIRLSDRSGIAACGLLDFQDSLVGPVAYDLVSLLEDARRDVSPAVSGEMMSRYLDAFPDIARADLSHACAALGVQRSVKIIGIFTRLDRRDGKPQYLHHIPRVWRWVTDGLVHPALSDVTSWFDTHWPNDLRVVPKQVS